MPDRTYLHSYGNDKIGFGPFGASPTRRTRDYIETDPVFARLHPVLLDRLFALADAVIDAGSDYGFGGGFRSSEQQKITFTSRYTKVDGWAQIYWDGSPSWPELAGYYTQNPGVAPSAPPGRSYHEATTPAGLALAADMVGDHVTANKLAARFELRHFADINGEPWHYQPVEIPNARRNYAGEFDAVTLQEDFMAGFQIVPGGTRVYDSRTTGGEFKPGEVRRIPVALGGEAFVAGACSGPAGWWSYSETDDFTAPVTSFCNTRNKRTWTNWGAIPVVCPGGHIYVKSLAGGHIYVDTYAFKAAS